MTYSNTLHELFAMLPMYQKIGKEAYKPGLERIQGLLEHLRHPEKKIKTIHVAGTNGKGSVSHMLSSILQEAGYKTGLYTSPHLVDFRERIKINGKPISKVSVVQFFETHKSVFKKLEPSFFEVTVAMAMQYFYEKKVDIAVIEVGLGGRLDSTNVITPELSVITNISYDHMDLLGDTLSKIATEKAGIIKSNIPIVIGETQQEVKSVFENIAQKQKATLFFADQIQKNAKYTSDLKGIYQTKNIKTVLQSISVLQKRGYQIKSQHIKHGLSHVVKNTGLQGRWQIIQKQPLIICDTGHNEAGMREILKGIKNTPQRQLHWVFGMVNDKDSSRILALLPKKALYYFCKPDIPRGKEADLLQHEADVFQLRGEVYKSVKQAYSSALKSASKDDLILIGGSTFVVGDFLAKKGSLNHKVEERKSS